MDSKNIDSFLFGFTDPWMYALSISAGAYLGNVYPKIEQELSDDVNGKRAERGLPPLVGTYGLFTSSDGIGPQKR
jgi:hypothetical protein